MGNSVVDLGAAALDYAEGVWDYMTGAPEASASGGYYKNLGPGARQYFSGPGDYKKTNPVMEYFGFEDGGSPAVELQNDGSLPGVDELRYMTPAEVEEGSYSFLQNMEEQMLGHLAAAQSVHDEDLPVRQSLDMKRYHYEEAEKLRNQIEQFKERRASAIQNYPESETKLYMKEGEAPYVKGFPDALVENYHEGGIVGQLKSLSQVSSGMGQKLNQLVNGQSGGSFDFNYGGGSLPAIQQPVINTEPSGPVADLSNFGPDVGNGGLFSGGPMSGGTPMQLPGPRIPTFAEPPRGMEGQPGDVNSAWQAAVKSAQERRKNGFMGQVVLPGEGRYEDFVKLYNYNLLNPKAQPTLGGNVGGDNLMGLLPNGGVIAGQPGPGFGLADEGGLIDPFRNPYSMPPGFTPLPPGELGFTENMIDHPFEAYAGGSKYFDESTGLYTGPDRNQDPLSKFGDGGVVSLGAGEPAYIDMGNMDMNSMFATPAQPGDEYYVGEYPGRVYREGDYITEPGYLGPEYQFEVEGPERYDMYQSFPEGRRRSDFGHSAPEIAMETGGPVPEMPEEAGIASFMYDVVTGNIPSEQLNALRTSGRIGDEMASAIYGDEPTFMDRLITDYNYPATIPMQDDKGFPVLNEQGGQKMAIATDFSLPEYMRTQRPRPDMPTYGELEDARAHALASAELARRYGPETAKTAGGIKELTEMLPGFGSSTYGDMKMDTRNNAFGIKLFREAGVNASPRDIAKSVDREVFKQLDIILGRSPDRQSTPAKDQPLAQNYFKSPEGGLDVYFPRDKEGYFDTTYLYD